jgi:SOS response regulatory protein OraA/RecX
MTEKELKQRLEDLKYAIIATETVLRYCSTPAYIEMHSKAIEYYREEIRKIEEVLNGKES